MRRSVAGFAPLVLVLSPLFGAGPPNTTGSEEWPPDLQALARQAQAIADAVQKHHVDPPSRQRMYLAGIEAMDRGTEVPPSDAVTERLFTRADVREFAKLLAEADAERFAKLLIEVWPRPSREGTPARKPVDFFIAGMLRAVPGGAGLLSGKAREVDEQMEGNRYVGLHVRLGFDDEKKRPWFVEIFERGPAARAGIRVKDRLEEIDGDDAHEMNVTQAIDRLRGAEGTDVVLKVRQPGDAESRTIRVTRRAMPHPTALSLRGKPADEESLLLSGDLHEIAYLTFQEIIASTPHEFRQATSRLESAGARALVLDLRRVRRSDFHSALLLADSLLEGGIIGRVQMSGRVMTYRADPDELCHGWPLAVLVDEQTRGAAEWLAAALQDNHRAVIVGRQTPGDAAITSRVALADGDSSITLVTGLMQRADGRPIGKLSSIDEARRLIRAQRVPQQFDPASEDTVSRVASAQVGKDTMPVDSPFGVKPDHVVTDMVGKRKRRGGEPVKVTEEEDVLKKAAALLLEKL